MNIQPIQMDPRIARIHYKDYMAACREHRKQREIKRQERAHQIHQDLYKVRLEKTQMEREDLLLLKAYRALAKGQRILDVDKAIDAAGLNAKMLPKLAIVQANAQRCYIDTIGDQFVRFKAERSTWRKDQQVQVKMPTKYAELTDTQWRKNNNYPMLWNVSAMVPTIPPTFRPADPENYHILWEAEWEHTAPVDPVLLKHIDGRLYTVIAQWDLTPLERSVLEARS
jgi:hypothetical protein